MVEPESAKLAAARHSEEDMEILKDLTDRFNALAANMSKPVTED